MNARSRWLAGVMMLATASTAPAWDDWFDRLDEFLTVSAFDGKVRARVSGTLDLEGFILPQGAGGLLYTDTSSFANPRLTVFLDAQLGPNIYLFTQSRADRGFDPGYEGSRVGMDEYAIRFTPWKDGRFTFQIGRFATMVGNWSLRHGSWDNPFINAPLPYENLTGIWDSQPASNVETLQYWAGFPEAGEVHSDAEILESRFYRVPLIWGPSYNSGIAAFGQIGKFEYAIEVKNTALCSRPEAWGGEAVGWNYPNIDGRIGYKPNASWTLGFSASSGTYLNPDAESLLAAGAGFNDYRQTLLGQDLRFEWHKLQVWAEVFEGRFTDPGYGHADTIAYYIETKYKLTPKLYGAVRWGQQLFGKVPDGNGGSAPWGGDTWRADLAIGYRLSAYAQVKLQYTVENREVDNVGIANMFAAQFTLRF